MTTIEAITPVREVITDPSALLNQYLGAAGFAGGMVRRMAKYPAQMPPVGQRQSLGAKFGNPRRKRSVIGGTGYRRTGTLGRGWRIVFVGIRGADFVSDVLNFVAYTTYVQGDPDAAPGERQTPVMRARGWQNIVDESAAEWAIWHPRIVRLLTQQGVQQRRL